VDAGNLVSCPWNEKKLRQCVLKITKYADKLLERPADIDWHNSTQRQQIAWIGRSDCFEIDVELFPMDSQFAVDTTRRDMIIGATFLVLAPECEIAGQPTTMEKRQQISECLCDPVAREWSLLAGMWRSPRYPSGCTPFESLLADTIAWTSIAAATTDNAHGRGRQETKALTICSCNCSLSVVLASSRFSAVAPVRRFSRYFQTGAEEWRLYPPRIGRLFHTAMKIN
jgi:hypothetical protein